MRVVKIGVFSGEIKRVIIQIVSNFLPWDFLSVS